MGWFSSSRRHKKSKSEHAVTPPLPPRGQVTTAPGKPIPQVRVQQSQSQSQALYTIPAASATTTSVKPHHQSPTHPYHHQTASSVHLSPSRSSPYRHRVSSSAQLSSPSSHPSTSSSSLAKWQSYTSLSGMVSQTVGIANTTMTGLEHQMKEYMSCGVDAYGVMLRKLDNVITSMDEGLFTGKDKMGERPSDAAAHTSADKDKSSNSNALTFFSKVYLYTNSRLPPQLPPLNLYPAGHALLRLAAQYSRNVYKRPSAENNPAYFDADYRNGTKAMVIKSLAVDDMKTVVIAIRGTQSFHDWAVNMKTAPTAPRGFLDDPFNLCHAGFLSVAQKMVHPVASRLRDLLAEDPSRANYSILITGHSAGGAVASLLYCHMFAATGGSELTHLRTFFRNVHCVTFGAPPVSLRPLAPFDPSSIFFSVVNEGDPVPRADKTYVSSLMNLYMSPAPISRLYGRHRPSKPALWRIPPATLSVAGQVIVLRKRDATGTYSAVPAESVEACMTTDAVLRQAVFGDPLMHMMDLYARRIHDLPGKQIKY
ncbi:lipase family protein [Aspergillus affinis]|uniref:lipase family protein n=1 Tax=Aspergillus affinis TaxID=1070780 RepID=UPI0022FE0BC7|nr:alpha/beta-hydrolase [Aspergillus affinis]KAI9037508.1 alpha/beta-hydrolase [Aspergillus affinis]